MAWVGERQRRYCPDRLPRIAQRLSARHQDPETGTFAKKCIGGTPAGVPEVLTIVQKQQQRSRSQRRRERSEHWDSWLFGHLKRGGDGVRHGGGIRDPGQFHNPHAVIKFLEEDTSNFDGEARLPAAARAGKAHQRGGMEEPGNLRDLAGTPDEAGQIRGEIIEP